MAPAAAPAGRIAPRTEQNATKIASGAATGGTLRDICFLDWAMPDGPYEGRVPLRPVTRRRDAGRTPTGHTSKGPAIAVAGTFWIP
jgi:hypothetical protein